MKEFYLNMEPAELKAELSTFLAKDTDFYSTSAEMVIRHRLAQYKGIGDKTAYSIYMKAVNGTYTGPAMLNRIPY